MTMPAAASLHPVECLLEKLEIGSLPDFFARDLNQFFLKRVFGWTNGLVENPEHAGERERGEFVGSELVGDVVAELVLGRAVPFLLLDDLEAAAFARVSRIEHVGA